MPGWRIHDQAVPQEKTRTALRLIWLDLFRRGLLPDEVDNYRRTADWFAWLKQRGEIRALRPDGLAEPGWVACPPQIVVQPPDTEETPIVLHRDDDGPEGPYALVAGVALTRQTRDNGGLWFRDAQSEQIIHGPLLMPGDVLTFDGRAEHASGINLSDEVRVAVYFRWKAPSFEGQGNAASGIVTGIAAVANPTMTSIMTNVGGSQVEQPFHVHVPA